MKEEDKIFTKIIVFYQSVSLLCYRHLAKDGHCKYFQRDFHYKIGKRALAQCRSLLINLLASLLGVAPC